ncbi:MAG: iron-sulfur cluster assembly scaffold protein [Thermoplasmata archaeon]
MAWDMYQEMILQHYRSPRNFGPLDAPTMEGEERNPSCGDHITMRLRLDPSGTRVDQVRFTGDGCAISMAGASMLTEHVAGRPIEEVARLTRDDVLGWLGIPLSPVRIKCALTGFAALGKALHPRPASDGAASPA